MADIKASSVPTSIWNLKDWMVWHKALVKKYDASTALVMKGDLKLLANIPAQTEFNSAFKKLTDSIGGWNGKDFLPVKQIMSGSEDDNIKVEKKYFSMWAGLMTSNLLILRNADPLFAVGKAVDTVGDIGSSMFKILKWTAIIGLPLAAIVVSAYVYNTFKKKKQ